MAASSRVRGYVLAGGRSSRMGTDKAEIVFEGRTLLDRAVATMGEACAEVTVVGDRKRVPEGTASVPDGVPGCGPVGGIEAALGDCVRKGGEIAVFLPVDMPLLPGGLLRALVGAWTASKTMRLGVVVEDGRMQPLISAVHAELLAAVRAALGRGDYKLQPVLRSAAEDLARRMDVPLAAVFAATPLRLGNGRVLAGDDGAELPWRPSPLEWERRLSWFKNLNTPAELAEACGGENKELVPPLGEEHHT